jgi:hypothetical protein
MPMTIGAWLRIAGQVDVIDTGAAVVIRDRVGNYVTLDYEEWLILRDRVIEDRFAVRALHQRSRR